MIKKAFFAHSNFTDGSLSLSLLLVLLGNMHDSTDKNLLFKISL